MPEIARTRPAEDTDERGTLTGLLDFLRATVELKLAGLTEEQAFARPVQPSALTPGGIVKHLTGVERFWFAIDFAGLDVEWPWSEEDPHGCFPIDPGDTVDGLLAAYRAECARSREIVAGASFDDQARSEGMTFTLRYAVAHLIEETARHLGHLDLLRESTDGQAGE
ncbi:DinB family protein [Kribbella sp.]|uniref:DinB family protein n=1 Tax=Kribbella sp. TaxID=1871183 RepID=UPI002D5A56C6|nr:DinB family protein [Kribbella sp.]HZX05715.1 DinB family protein [Kribbella sp.]